MPNQEDRKYQVFVRTLDEEDADKAKLQAELQAREQEQEKERERARIAAIEGEKAREVDREVAREVARLKEEAEAEEYEMESEIVYEEPSTRNETYAAYNSGDYVSPIDAMIRRKFFAVVGGKNFAYDDLASASSTLEELQKIKNKNESKSFLPDKLFVRKEDRFGNSDNYAERVEGEERRRRLIEIKLKAKEIEAGDIVKFYKDRLPGNPSNYGYILIHMTKRNSFVTLTDNKFQLQKVRSAGSLGPVDNSIKYKGKKKNSATAREAVAFAAAGHALEIKRRIFYVIFKARERVNSSYLSFLKGLLKRKLLIQAFCWRNPTAHGYVRYRKKRRI
jgi:ribosomal protein S11